MLMLIRENVINNKMKKVRSLKVLRTERIFKEQYMKIEKIEKLEK